MSELIGLWLPILVSAFVVFFASFVAWSLLSHHKPEWQRLPDEDRFSSMLRELDLPPGQFVFPYSGDAETMKSKAYLDRLDQGPNGTICVWSVRPDMNKNLLCTFLFFLCVSFCLAYLATIGLEPGAGFLAVFRFVGTAGILAYASAGIPNAIWFKRKILMDILDGVAYGLLTGVVFGLLWPTA